MSRWEHDNRIHSEISGGTGELMLSASDAIAWIRACAAITTHPCAKASFEALADTLASDCINATSGFLDRSDP